MNGFRPLRLPIRTPVVARTPWAAMPASARMQGFAPGNPKSPVFAKSGASRPSPSCSLSVGLTDALTGVSVIFDDSRECGLGRCLEGLRAG
jgi:hypothetical protein